MSQNTWLCLGSLKLSPYCITKHNGDDASKDSIFIVGMCLWNILGHTKPNILLFTENLNLFYLTVQSGWQPS